MNTLHTGYGIEVVIILLVVLSNQGNGLRRNFLNEV